MRTIENYDDFVAAIKDKSSEDREVRNEAKNALGNFHIKYPERFDKYKARYDGIMPVEPIAEPKSSRPRKTAYDKEQYIMEHPEINVIDLRKKARIRLTKGEYGFGLRYDVPVWLTEYELLSSVDQLTISDLITSSGKPVPRQTLLRKCIKIAIADGRFDDKKARALVISLYSSYYNNRKNGFYKYHPPYSSAAIREMIKYDATMQEVADIVIDGSMNFFKLFRLAEKKGLKIMTAQEWERLEKIQATNEENRAKKQAHKIAKREARKARKEAAKQQALKEKLEKTKNNQE